MFAFVVVQVEVAVPFHEHVVEADSHAAADAAADERSSSHRSFRFERRECFSSQARIVSIAPLLDGNAAARCRWSALGGESDPALAPAFQTE